MRISDWSSDVCSSDLAGAVHPHLAADEAAAGVGLQPDRPGDIGAQIVAVDDARIFGIDEDIEPEAGLGRQFDQGIADDRALVRSDAGEARDDEAIGRAHVRTPVTNTKLVHRLLIEKKQVQMYRTR